MYGVVSTRRQASGAPGWVPEDALAHLDFVNGQYWADGAERAVGALLGGGFDAGDIEAGGMAVWETNANRPNAIGALADVLEAGIAAGMSVVFEFSHTSGAMAGALLVFIDGADIDASTNTIETYSFNTAGARISSNDLFHNVNLPAYSGSLTRVGLTLYRPLGGGEWESSIVIDGDLQAGASETTTDSGAENLPTVANIYVGHVDEWDVAFVSALIRSITVYPAVDEAALAALTA